MALKLRLPGVEETTSWGEPTLKAHGKLWVWWSPHEDAPVFKVPFEEREVLVEAAPDTFFFTPHYKSHPLVLVRPEKLDLDWAKANLIRVWRDQAPKRVLKAYDEAQAAQEITPDHRRAPGDTATQSSWQVLNSGRCDCTRLVRRDLTLPGTIPYAPDLEAALRRSTDFARASSHAHRGGRARAAGAARRAVRRRDAARLQGRSRRAPAAPDRMPRRASRSPRTAPS